MKFAIGIDRIHSASSDKALLAEFCKLVEAKGHTVTNVGRGPNQVQSWSLSHSSDCMVQIAGGMCIGTTSDFCYGMKKGYYHAKKGCIPLYTKGWTKYDPDTYVPRKGAWDDNFSHRLPRSWFTQFLNINFPTVYKKFSQYLLPYSHGKSAQEMAEKMLGGTSSSTDNKQQGGGGSSGLDLIKQVCSDWDPYGVDLDLHGDTVSIKKTNPFSGMTVDESMIVADSVSFVDYDRDTPNSNGNIKDKFLINRFGEVPLDTEIKTEPAQILQMAQRGHNHTLELKTRIHKNIKEGNWINLNIPTLGIENRKYYISKLGYQEERYYTLTLDVAPPSVHVDVQEVTEEETTESTEESTEEEAT